VDFRGILARAFREFAGPWAWPVKKVAAAAGRGLGKTRKLAVCGVFVDVDSLRKMPVQSGIWQGWQMGKALRARSRGPRSPSCPCRMEPGLFSPRWNAGKPGASSGGSLPGGVSIGTPIDGNQEALDNGRSVMGDAVSRCCFY